MEYTLKKIHFNTIPFVFPSQTNYNSIANNTQFIFILAKCKKNLDCWWKKFSKKEKKKSINIYASTHQWPQNIIVNQNELVNITYFVCSYMS